MTSTPKKLCSYLASRENMEMVGKRRSSPGMAVKIVCGLPAVLNVPLSPLDPAGPQWYRHSNIYTMPKQQQQLLPLCIALSAPITGHRRDSRTPRIDIQFELYNKLQLVPHCAIFSSSQNHKS
ncbi:hypothetical protein VTL71DRAFT_13396, partial [Oculimacula yallundae]